MIKQAYALFTSSSRPGKSSTIYLWTYIVSNRLQKCFSVAKLIQLVVFCTAIEDYSFVGVFSEYDW